MGPSEVFGEGVGAIFRGGLDRGAVERKAHQSGIHHQIGGGKVQVCQKRDTSLRAQVK